MDSDVGRRHIDQVEPFETELELTRRHIQHCQGCGPWLRVGFEAPGVRGEDMCRVFLFRVSCVVFCVL